MLPQERRVTAGRDIQRCIRSGSRGSSALLTAYVTRAPSTSRASGTVIVSRKVGGSVVRHRVQRRLRHQLAPLLDRLSPGTCVVVRAHPSAATASSADLAREMERAVSKALSGRRA